MSKLHGLLLAAMLPLPAPAIAEMGGDRNAGGAFMSSYGGGPYGHDLRYGETRPESNGSRSFGGWAAPGEPSATGSHRADPAPRRPRR